MAKRAMYEELDEAIEDVLAGDTFDRDRALVNLAEELKRMPSMEFRARLKSDLQDHAMFIAAGRKYERPAVTGRVLQMPRPLFASGAATYPVSSMNFALSLALHVAVLALLVSSGAWFVRSEKIKSGIQSSMVDPSLYVLTVTPKQAGGGGGGGDHDKVVASQGRLPKQAAEQITPPAVVLRNDHARLTVDPAVVAPPIDMAANMPNLGDPMARVFGPASNGPGSNGGIGSGSNGGVGSGIGAGVGPGYGGGIGEGIYRVGGGVSAPRVLYAPDPDYSEEARKAKFQGTVTLWLIVGADGRPRDTKVARSLGMGLDERAIAAVRQWKFQPALKDGRPVAVQINVEVNFRMF